MAESSYSTNRSEIVLMAALFVMGAYMFVEALSFSPGPRRVPLITSAAMMVGIAIIAVREVLMTTGYWPVSEEDESFDPEPEEKDAVTEEEDDAELSDEKLVQITGLTIGYIALGYAVGLAWATPLFAVGYSLLFGLTKRQTIVVVIVTLLAILMFTQLTTLRLTQGALF